MSYVALATTTLASSASSVTFSSIDQSYGDLVLVVSGTNTVGLTSILLRFNSDTGSNYSRVFMEGDGSGPDSVSSTDSSLKAALISNSEGVSIMQILDYSATDKHKSLLARAATDRPRAVAGRYASTSAITTMEVLSESDDFDTGTTFSLYGIAK